MSQLLLTVLPTTQGREVQKMEENGEEEEPVYTFTAYEIDLDFEFDAARFFDFTREESPLEARQVEAWFESAGSYPPSLPGKEISYGNVNLPPNCGDNGAGTDSEICFMRMHSGDEECRNQGTPTNVLIEIQKRIQDKSQKLPSGLNFCNHMVDNVNSKNQSELVAKSTYHRTSTFMKPTLSHLAKQNRPFQTEYSRSHMFVLNKPSKISASTCVVENQPAKRQKLDGGLQRKVSAVQLQQANFVHKAPKLDKYLCGDPTSIKPRITIPIEPDLETARRAQRTMLNIRGRSIKDGNVNSTMHQFKDLPLNKKIRETPVLLPKRSFPSIPDFQEYHLKMSERAKQHGSAILNPRVPLHHPTKRELHKYSPTSTNECRREPKRTGVVNIALNSDGALPLNMEILTSNGDIGDFQDSKKEVTDPIDFNLQSQIMLHNNPPVELFSKFKQVLAKALKCCGISSNVEMRQNHRGTAASSA